MRCQFVVLGAVGLCLLFSSKVQADIPLSTGFTYQGQMIQNGTPANGAFDLTFSLWDAAGTASPPTGGNQVGETITRNDVVVSNGLFTVNLNAGGGFGVNAFTGQARWLQIAERTGPALAITPHSVPDNP